MLPEAVIETVLVRLAPVLASMVILPLVAISVRAPVWVVLTTGIFVTRSE